MTIKYLDLKRINDMHADEIRQAVTAVIGMKTQESKNCSPSLQKRWNIIKAKHNTVI